MRILCWLSLVSVLVAFAAQQVSAIVGSGRDVVLTPKQPLQLNGKRLYYEEQLSAAGSAEGENSWQHTLKHVTYVTLFTDAALGAASGNLSQLHDYHDFLQTPYVPARGAAGQAQSPLAHFGDIVTLASGRLEQLSSNGSYRFIEGTTDATDVVQRDPDVRTRALWRVQRIRHRNGEQSPSNRHRLHHRYHYEMKYSVSPVTANFGLPPQSYIQKESDYPQSFGRIAYEEKRDQAFAQRRQDRQPQATFVRGIFQPPPPPPPASALNIGEYLKVSPEPAKSSPKIELFPGLFNLGLRPNYIPATTFRPSYPIKFRAAHPELTTPLEHFPLLNELPVSGSAGDAGGVAAAAPPVTHHFHHHFYMATGHGSSQTELGYRPSLSTEPAPPTSSRPQTHLHSQQHPIGEEEAHREVQFPTSHAATSSSESLETDEDLHHSQDQHALRSPHVYTVYDHATKYQTSKLKTPLLIYAGAGAEAESSGAGEDHKSFEHSEPLEETIYRYSEPDPLYVHQNPVDVLQLGTPHHQQQKQQQKQQHQQHPQQQHHASEQSIQSEAVEHPEGQQGEHVDGEEQRPAGSQKQASLASTPAPSTTITSSTEATTTTSKPTAAAAPSKASFVSTSTSFMPLRTLSRYRTTPRITAGRSTTSTPTSTEPPTFSKWKQRRKSNTTSGGMDSNPKSSLRHESKVIFVPTTTPTTTTTSTSTKSPVVSTESPTLTPTTTATAASVLLKPATTGREVIEVLTQKSVSKSVSIKVGENGEEIPIIVDDDESENEVKPS